MAGNNRAAGDGGRVGLIGTKSRIFYEIPRVRNVVQRVPLSDD